MESMGYVRKAKNLTNESGNWTTKSIWDGLKWKE